MDRDCAPVAKTTTSEHVVNVVTAGHETVGSSLTAVDIRPSVYTARDIDTSNYAPMGMVSNRPLFLEVSGMGPKKSSNRRPPRRCYLDHERIIGAPEDSPHVFEVIKKFKHFQSHRRRRERRLEGGAHPRGTKKSIGLGP